MPYGRFLRACEATNYDLLLLQRRFGVSFEQLAHRLTTLHRVGQRGLPFFMARIDAAGQFSKRYKGASNTRLLDGAGTCPLWSPHMAPQTLTPQWVELAELGNAPTQWLTLSQTQTSSQAHATPSTSYTIILGLEARFAQNLAPILPATPIGLGCMQCPRRDCRQRAIPPRGAALQFNERERGLTPFDFNG
jgi:predicted transcriptional regulator